MAWYFAVRVATSASSLDVSHDLSGHVIGSVAQRSAAPQPIETEAPPSLELKILKILPNGAGATVNRGADTGTIRLFSCGGVVLKLGDESSAQSDPTVITIRDAYELIVNGYVEWLDPPPQVRPPARSSTRSRPWKGRRQTPPARCKYVSTTTGVPQIAADLLQRPSGQPWASSGHHSAVRCMVAVMTSFSCGPTDLRDVPAGS
jgi:hypothetical protein